MSNEQKKRPETLAGHRNESNAGQTKNRGFSDSSDHKGPGVRATGGKPVRLSQEEAQSMPVDRDPDDPVSR